MGPADNTLWYLFQIDGPGWLDTSRWLALGSVIASHIWKWRWPRALDPCAGDAWSKVIKSADIKPE